MLALLLLAAGMSTASARTTHRQYPRSVDQRVALLEAKEILQGHQLWYLQANLPPETLRALQDVQLHLHQDAEQEERVRSLQTEVQSLQLRLATLELLVRGAMPEGNAILVAPEQTIEIPKATKKRKKRRPVITEQ